MKTKLIILAASLIGMSILSVGCASALGQRMGWDKSNEKPNVGKLDVPEFSTCDGLRARKKFVFTLSGKFQLPAGTPIEKASQNLASQEADYSYAAANWIRHLLSFGLGQDSEGKWNYGSENIQGLAKYSEISRLSIIRTGPFNFLFCDGQSCAGSQDPVNKAKVAVGKYRATQNGYAFEDCQWYYVPGIDPSPEDPSFLSLKRDTYPQACYPRPSFDQGGFMMDTGFRGGTMFNINYFSVPDAQKSQVCNDAGLNDNCFALPKATEISDYCNDPGFAKKFPFTNHFLRNISQDNRFGDICLKYNDFEYRRNFLETLRDDGGHTKLVWENAWSKDLFLLSSVKVKKTVQSGWTISRIEWDPTPFCKYAKPKSDLVTH